MEPWIMLLAMLVLFSVYAWFHSRGEVLTGAAAVVSRRVELGRFSGRSYHNSTWDYLVTFRFRGGEEIELYVPEGLYGQLEEGSTGQLIWCKDVVSEFIPDMEVAL